MHQLNRQRCSLFTYCKTNSDSQCPGNSVMDLDVGSSLKNRPWLLLEVLVEEMTERYEECGGAESQCFLSLSKVRHWLPVGRGLKGKGQGEANKCLFFLSELRLYSTTLFTLLLIWALVLQGVFPKYLRQTVNCLKTLLQSRPYRRLRPVQNHSEPRPWSSQLNVKWK